MNNTYTRNGVTYDIDLVVEPLYGNALRDTTEDGYSIPKALQETDGDDRLRASMYAATWESEYRRQQQRLSG